MTGSILPALVAVLALVAGGCGSRSDPEITSESEAGFRDLVFAIREHKKLADGRQAIRAYGVYDGKEVGLEVLLGPAWREVPQGGGMPLVMYGGKVRYRSLGPESALLLQTMDRLYGTKLHPTTMNREITFTGISLEGDPRDLRRGMVKVKLFFEADAEDRYAEVFTNIDLAARKLYVREKDPEYRGAVIRALSAS